METFIYKHKKPDVDIELRSIDEKINTAISKFFDQYFENFFISSNDLLSRFYPTFENELFSYFDRKYPVNINPFTLQDSIFNNLTIISIHYQNFGLYNMAQEYWEHILNSVLSWEKLRKERIHKGSIYYFWAENALLNNEIDKGFFLIHNSFIEDCITHKTNNPNTPSQKTVSLNADENNLLFGFVLSLKEKILEYIKKYNKDNQKTMTEGVFNNKFLLNPPSKDLLFSFSHSIALINQIFRFQPYVRQSDFAGMYEINVLFNLVLVIDNLLFRKTHDQNSRDDWKFLILIKNLLSRSNIEKNQDNFYSNIKSVNKSVDHNFDQTILELIEKRYKFPEPQNISPLYFDIFLCYVIRNNRAHNISLSSSIAKNFPAITTSVFNVLLLSIEID